MTTSVTCSNCPSFLGRSDTAQSATTYGKPLGVPSCPRVGMMLCSNQMSSDQETNLQAEVASRCSQYGKPSSGKVMLGLSIGVGVPKVAPPANTPTAKTCRSCFFYVPAAKMIDEIGVNLGLCSKFANLLPESKTTEIASNCRSAARLTLDGDLTPSDHQSDLLSHVTIDPLLSQYLGLGEVIESKVEKAPEPIADPRTYVSDLPVTAQHLDKGIRAWRKLERDGKKVYLPIFRNAFFMDDEVAKIPQIGDDERPEQYVDHLGLAFITAVLWRELDETPALHGVAGTGKTEFFRYMAWLMQLPFERISITRSTELDDLAGKTHFENDETIFKPGRIPRAWAKPCVIVLDEPNVGTPDVWQFIRPLTDNSKQLVLDMNEGQVIKRNDHAYMGMAMNPAWDSRNIGAEVISDADGSRLMHIFVTLPPEKMERQIIRERCKADGYDLPGHLLDQIMGVAKDLRAMSDDQTLPITWGVRQQIKVARATKFFSLREAYRLAATDYLEPEVGTTILDTVKNHGR